MFYLNSIEQLENLVGLEEQLEVCLTCSRLLAAIQMLLLHQKLRCSKNKMTLYEKVSMFMELFKILRENILPNFGKIIRRKQENIPLRLRI